MEGFAVEVRRVYTRASAYWITSEQTANVSDKSCYHGNVTYVDMYTYFSINNYNIY